MSDTDYAYVDDDELEPSGPSERVRRRRRTLITLGVVVLVLFFAFWYGLSYYQASSDEKGSGTPAATCATPDPKVATAENTEVRVYNATTRAGLAGKTANAFKARGFTVSAVANDPTSRPTPATAEVRYGPKGAAQARLVLAQLPKGTTSINDKRATAVVDVALGTRFQTLLPAASPSAGTLPPCPTPSAT